MIAPTSPTCRSPLSQHSFRPESPGPSTIPDPTTGSSTRRQSIAPSPRRLSTSRSLAGSYTLSLLSSRMSAAHPTHHVPSAFTLKIGSVSPACTGTRSAQRAPEHVKIAFDARWYELEGAAEAAAWTPWVGNVDVEGFYARRRRGKTLEWARGQCEVAVDEDHADDDTQAQAQGPDLDTYYERILKGWIPTPHDIHLAPPSDRPLLRRMQCPPKPGYELGITGKLQFFIMQTLDQPATSAACPLVAGTSATPVKVFLVDYDLGSLEPGGRLLYKERAYQTIPADPLHASHSPSSPVTSLNPPSGKPKPREVLKYAFELHFLCTDTRSANSTANTETKPKPKRQSRSYYLGKQIRLVFPTSSGSLNTSDGPASTTTTTTAQTVPKPSVRIERLIEVQNPSPISAPTTSDAPLVIDGVGKTGRCGSFTSESWQGLRGAWAGRESVSPGKVESNSIGSAHGRRPVVTQSPLKAPPTIEEVPPAAVAAASLTFARSPTPIPPLSLKSPSLLTARLEEMSGLSPQSYSPSLEKEPAEEPTRMASPGARKRTLWPADDTERLLSESLQKLHVSYR